ncbi:DUF2787 family protein [Vibrio algivorus]|uniref:DUF2787 domain-containing protein n=1 Tax=Vibrio algivorus TaxID=1667024 RepID=A0A557NTU7_9VIBR|nr:DUF2787 family protein [Vibrio algivorus]TVO31735.1 DUF2787 domain-containing protein [Vibrio algivorus]
MTGFVIESHLLPVSCELSQALYGVLRDESMNLSGDALAQARTLTFNFRDESYTAESGGFHPVEIRLKRASIKFSSWQLAYITTFAYIGNVYPELERNLDFDCQSGRCLVHPYIQWEPIKDNQDVLSMYQLWESNFLAYLNSDSYSIHQITLDDTHYFTNGENTL